jgi:hypothetical protein
MIIRSKPNRACLLAVFERMTAATGGKAYFAKTWKDEKWRLLRSAMTSEHYIR